MRIIGLLVATAIGLTAAGRPQTMKWTVDGVTREAIVVAPSANAASGRAPLIFAFHGHGDDMENFSGVRIEDSWPEAVVVYPQGLPTSRNGANAPDALPGWQVEEKTYGDRDLKLVDAMLKDLHQKYKLDDARIYSTGFSNGSNFSYLLWAARPNVFAAFAVVAGRVAGSVHLVDPKPLLHIAGRQDRQIPFAQQQEAIEEARKVDGATGAGKPCGNGCTLYDSTKGAPVMTVFHDGGHVYPSNAPELIVKFLQSHPGSAH